jgi:hypothetical protein
VGILIQLPCVLVFEGVPGGVSEPLEWIVVDGNRTM